ncbi:hypothetical protein HDV00_000954 [Rhizophlyctis rosea]|nr:hypothetical protein HDV00_000954 [Rhizophlyctis rosea]
MGPPELVEVGASVVIGQAMSTQTDETALHWAQELAAASALRMNPILDYELVLIVTCIFTNPTTAPAPKTTSTVLFSSDLLTLFAPFGPIESLRILLEKECAFVNDVGVVRAKEEMQGGRVGSSIIRVGYRKAETTNDTQGMRPTKSLWVGNIPPTTDPAEPKAMFSANSPPGSDSPDEGTVVDQPTMTRKASTRKALKNFNYGDNSMASTPMFWVKDVKSSDGTFLIGKRLREKNQESGPVTVNPMIDRIRYRYQLKMERVTLYKNVSCKVTTIPSAPAVPNEPAKLSLRLALRLRSYGSIESASVLTPKKLRLRQLPPLREDPMADRKGISGNEIGRVGGQNRVRPKSHPELTAHLHLVHSPTPRSANVSCLAGSVMARWGKCGWWWVGRLRERFEQYGGG